MTATVAMAARILVVEDDLDSRESLCLVLRAAGHEVEGVATGRDAIRVGGATPWDVVVLDLGLHDVGGEAVAAALKAGSPAPFVVAYSGFNRREADARRAGCDAFVLKPGFDELRTLVSARSDPRARGVG